jgi:hypothetical protein
MCDAGQRSSVMLSQPAQGPKAHWHFWGEAALDKAFKPEASRRGGGFKAMEFQGLSARIAIDVARVKEMFGRSEFSSFTALRITRSDRSMVTGPPVWAPCLPLSVGYELGSRLKAHILPHILFSTGVKHGTNHAVFGRCHAGPGR